ncbi:hypothetical protein [Parasporobacterium paucivorans]|uniref:Uncharacterized protein n=1 Tax=Parasporobacterium paucivorans DSM 15970 TaxID=1122934 RepID=A0A1M6IU54_9FIRM|nr:hypothetical protein [Parasporobacterium paucivorans]SHJ37966.1 hypothetical protein SAMN02745691_01854 [Parasporobacterium paucivorans DSM 15970]
MAVNFIGPILMALLVASAIGVITGLVVKNKKVLLISFIALVVIVAIYVILSMFFE